MRQMSFALTTQQMIAKTKTVTRRRGWATLKPGTLLQAVEKSQGLRKGEKVRKLGVIRVVDVQRETLFAMHHAPSGECAREGFPDLTPAQFIAMFCEANDCTTGSVVTRIEFEHLSADEARQAKADDAVLSGEDALIYTARLRKIAVEAHLKAKAGGGRVTTWLDAPPCATHSWKWVPTWSNLGFDECWRCGATGPVTVQHDLPAATEELPAPVGSVGSVESVGPVKPATTAVLAELAKGTKAPAEAAAKRQVQEATA